jgi:cation diffusion facilitator CzcD-associated flavoprotein CzcO
VTPSRHNSDARPHVRASGTTRPPVVVVGAGGAGLASATMLRRRGVPAIVLDRAKEIGSSWRGRYDRLRLNSSRWFSKLPGARWPRGTGIFPSRDEMVRYLEDYAADNRLDLRLGTELHRVDRNNGSWMLRTSSGDLAADHVVVASGYDHSQHIPEWPGRDRFTGQLLHVGDYRNPEPFRGSDVLVVGPGCSGMEIAYDLAENGAGRVRLAVRTPPNILVRSPIGPLLARMLYKLPPDRVDRLLSRVRKREIGDLTEYGLPEPEEGIFTRLRRLGVAPAIVDHDVIDTLRDRRIEIVGAVESMDQTGTLLADGTRIEADAVIAATGYRRGLEPLLGHLGVLDGSGRPRVAGGESAAPGLHLVGYVPRPAPFGYFGSEAALAASQIARERASR